MDPDLAGLLELSLVFGSVLALLIWELVSLRRSQKKDEVERRKADEEARREAKR